MFTKATTVLGLAALALGTAASAASTSVEFRYRDLDLSTEAGQQELERRIDTAVRRACPDETVTGSRISSNADRAECMADVRSQIAARINSRTKGGSSSR